MDKKEKGIVRLEDYELADPSKEFLRRYRCIEIDPPWQYKDKGYNGHETVQKYRIHCPYPTMSLPHIWLMGNAINSLADERCHLWMWTTKDFLAAALLLIESWGWDFKQMFTWIKTTKDGKPTYGMGYWGRNGCEYLLFAVNKSKDNRLLEATTTPNYFFAPNLGHSVKPDIAYEIIRRNSLGPRLSIFQRTHREGFDCWGNQMKPMADCGAPPRAELIEPKGDE